MLQDIASVAGAAAAGDDYDVRAVLACDGLGTLVCGLAGSVIAPVIYAMHPPYKAVGARISFAFWTPVLFLAIVMSGLTIFVAQLFPWPILAAIIAYVSIGVGMATLRRVDPKYLGAVLLGFVLPAGAVVATAVNSALPALRLSAANPVVQSALNRSIYWSSVLGLGNGFLFLVLVVASVIAELIDRRFGRAAVWCIVAVRVLLVRLDALGADALGRATGLCPRVAGRGGNCLLGPVVERRCRQFLKCARQIRRQHLGLLQQRWERIEGLAVVLRASSDGKNVRIGSLQLIVHHDSPIHLQAGVGAPAWYSASNPSR